MKVSKIILITGLLLIATFSVIGQQPEELSVNPNQRVALVIGNSDYLTGPLLNPVNDARAMANALRETDFDVIEYINLKTFADMKRAIREFGSKIQNGGVGLFYYAGHGIQVSGRNFLIPTEAEIYTEDEVEYESVDVGFVLAQMESANNRMNILILDACRNNPFARSWRSANQGLAFIHAPTGTLIAYATSPGSVASDGTGENGLYTEQLLNQIRKKGMKIEDVFKNVRAGVVDRSGGLHTPWEMSSLIGDFYFIEPDASETQMLTENLSVNKPFVDYYIGDETSLNTSLGSWKALDGYYNFYLGDQDVSNELEHAAVGDDIIVYHEVSDKTFLLKGFYNLQDNEIRPATDISTPSNAFWRATDEGYWFYIKGKGVQQETIMSHFDEHRLVYYPSTGTYYLVRNYDQFQDGKLRPAELLYTTNGTFWRANSEYYYLYVNGEQIAYRTNSQWSGNDLIVYDEEGGYSYLLKDYYNHKDNTLRSAEIVSGPGLVTWKRENNTYFMYRNGQQFASEDNTITVYSGNDLLVFEKSTKQSFLLPDWKNRADGTIRDAKVLYSPINAFWSRSGNTYWFYVEGKIVYENLTSEWNGDDLEVYDAITERTYVFPNYANSDDNTLRAAYLKE